MQDHDTLPCMQSWAGGHMDQITAHTYSIGTFYVQLVVSYLQDIHICCSFVVHTHRLCFMYRDSRASLVHTGHSHFLLIRRDLCCYRTTHLPQQLSTWAQRQDFSDHASLSFCGVELPFQNFIKDTSTESDSFPWSSQTYGIRSWRFPSSLVLFLLCPTCRNKGEGIRSS